MASDLRPSRGLSTGLGRARPEAVIHPPVRSEGAPSRGVSPFTPARSAGGIASLTEGINRVDRLPDPFSAHRQWEDGHHGLTIEACSGPFIIEPTVLAPSYRPRCVSCFRTTGSSTSSPTTTTTTRGLSPTSDTFIEKDSSINDGIDRLRHATTSSLLLRGLIVVASVSCIYGLGSPDDTAAGCSSEAGDNGRSAGTCCGSWWTSTTTATTPSSAGAASGSAATPSTHPPTSSRRPYRALRDTVERIRQFEALTGDLGDDLEELVSFARHLLRGRDETTRPAVIDRGRAAGATGERQSENKLLEAQRLRCDRARSRDLAEVGLVNGIETTAAPGRPEVGAAHTLLDFFPQDFLNRHRREGGPRGRP